MIYIDYDNNPLNELPYNTIYVTDNENMVFSIKGTSGIDEYIHRYETVRKLSLFKTYNRILIK